MELVFTPDAPRQLAAMPKVDAKRMREALDQVAEAHPRRMSFVTELVGEANAWRARKGDWRAVYTIVEGAMTVVAIKRRKDIHR